jgi:hypothetical protein
MPSAMARSHKLRTGIVQVIAKQDAYVPCCSRTREETNHQSLPMALHVLVDQHRVPVGVQ